MFSKMFAGHGHNIQRYARPCHAMLHHTIPRNATPRPVRHVIHYTTPHYTTSCHTTSCYAISHHVLLHQTMPCYTTPCPWHATPHYTMPWHITPHHRPTREASGKNLWNSSPLASQVSPSPLVIHWSVHGSINSGTQGKKKWTSG